jgi:cytochrome P450
VTIELMSTAPFVPTSDVDLFSDRVLRDPYPHFTRLRNDGAAAYLTKLDMWFLGRYDLVRAALLDWETYSSAQGVGMTAEFNRSMAAALICQDPPAHTAQRTLFTDNLSLRSLRPVSETIDARARELIARLRTRDQFDAVEDLAHDLPVNIIMDLVGWPMGVRDQLIPMAIAWFNTIGPMNDRSLESWPIVGQMVELVRKSATEESLRPGSFGHHVLEAHKTGAIPFDAVVGLLMGYIVAAFDTTINAISSAAVLLARHPEQWQALRAKPELASNAFNEVIRLESPIQYFTRVTTREVQLDDVVIPKHARVLISYGAANRDERRFDRADEFDITRPVINHLAFSTGKHNCAGQNLARLEGQAILRALATGVSSLELIGEPQLALNNAGRGYGRVPMKFRA